MLNFHVAETPTSTNIQSCKTSRIILACNAISANVLIIADKYFEQLQKIISHVHITPDGKKSRIHFPMDDDYAN